jgi:hypothetical protein
MVLTYDAYNETLEKQQEKDSEVKALKDKYEQDIKEYLQVEYLQHSKRSGTTFWMIRCFSQ